LNKISLILNLKYK
jgi:hypothetical protein